MTVSRARIGCTKIGTSVSRFPHQSNITNCHEGIVTEGDTAQEIIASIN